MKIKEKIKYMITWRILYKCKKYLEERINILFDNNIDLYIKGAKKLYYESLFVFYGLCIKKCETTDFNMN